MLQQWLHSSIVISNKPHAKALAWALSDMLPTAIIYLIYIKLWVGSILVQIFRDNFFLGGGGSNLICWWLDCPYIRQVSHFNFRTMKVTTRLLNILSCQHGLQASMDVSVQSAQTKPFLHIFPIDLDIWLMPLWQNCTRFKLCDLIIAHNGLNYSNNDYQLSLSLFNFLVK